MLKPINADLGRDFVVRLLAGSVCFTSDLFVFLRVFLFCLRFISLRELAVIAPSRERASRCVIARLWNPLDARRGGAHWAELHTSHPLHLHLGVCEEDDGLGVTSQS